MKNLGFLQYIKAVIGLATAIGLTCTFVPDPDT
jgi:hypothetical protein